MLQGALASAPLGATVTLNITEGLSAKPLLQVPLAAVYDAGKGPGVWEVSGKPARVSWQPVEVVNITDDAARVMGNLQPGEPVVALGAHLLHEGEAVRQAKQSDSEIAGSRP
mgnify:FL=1